MCTRHILIALAVTIPVAASARDPTGKWAQADPGIQQWFQEQRVPGTAMRCCDDADGETVREEIRQGQYWITGEHFPVWTPVPPERVLQGPNKAGHPVAWWGIQGDVTFVRCYAPGAGI